jgi:hypothetical protein
MLTTKITKNTKGFKRLLFFTRKSGRTRREIDGVSLLGRSSPAGNAPKLIGGLLEASFCAGIGTQEPRRGLSSCFYV